MSNEIELAAGQTYIRKRDGHRIDIVSAKAYEAPFHGHNVHYVAYVVPGSPNTKKPKPDPAKKYTAEEYAAFKRMRAPFSTTFGFHCYGNTHKDGGKIDELGILAQLTNEGYKLQTQ